MPIVAIFFIVFG